MFDPEELKYIKFLSMNSYVKHIHELELGAFFRWLIWVGEKKETMHNTCSTTLFAFYKRFFISNIFNKLLHRLLFIDSIVSQVVVTDSTSVICYDVCSEFHWFTPNDLKIKKVILNANNLFRYPVIRQPAAFFPQLLFLSSFVFVQRLKLNWAQIN